MAKQNTKNNLRLFLEGFKNLKVLLLLMFFLAVFLRSYNLGQTLFFGPEQGIDFWRMKTVAVDHTPVLVGAKTDIAGVFHGPIYYYVSSIPFVVSHGDPVFIAYFLILVNSLTVYFIFKATSEMFNKRTGLIASLLFAISFGAISYTHWLSSHPLVLPLSALFLLGMIGFLKGRRRYLFLATASYALLGQAEFLNYLLYGVSLVLIIVFFFSNFKKSGIKFLGLNLLVLFLLGIFHYVIFEVRNQFIMTKSIMSLTHGNGFYVSFPKVMQLVYEQFVSTQSSVLLPTLPAIFGITMLTLGIFVLGVSEHKIAKRLLITVILIPLFILIVLRHDILEQFFVYSIVPSIIIVSYLVSTLISKNRIFGAFCLLLICMVQLSAWYMYEPQDQNMFFESTQPDLKISDEKVVIDRIYSMEKGRNFSYQSYTIPYWSQQGWEYLFWQYGKGKYGYLPVTQNGKTLYVIIQDDPSSTKFQNDWLKYTVSKWGTYKDSFRIGIFTVRRLIVP